MENYFTKEKHYNTLDNYYKSKYNKKVFKIPLNAGFTCPNIDGKVGRGGCTFCSVLGSGEFAGKKGESLKDQFLKGVHMMEQKWSDGYYIPYFQSFSNTYAPIDILKNLYDEALSLSPKVIGISIATRPDCIDEEIVSLLKNLNTDKHFVQVELGLQTIHEKTSLLINRGHDLKSFEKAVSLLDEAGIEIVVHIINGLPGETKEMMYETIRYLNNFNIKGLKIHMLNILKNSRMGYNYKKEPWSLLTRDEYIDIVVNQLRLLRKDIVIHRLTGDGKFSELIEPLWIKRKFTVLNDIDKLMRKENFFQGDLYDKNS